MDRGTARVLCGLATGPIQPSHLAERAASDSTAVATAIDQLEAQSLVTHLEDGRVGLDPALTYDETHIRRLIPDRYQLTFRESVASTNALAGELSALASPPYHLVIAREQQQGRGRYDRDWHSPRGGIWASLRDDRHRDPTEAWTDQLAMSVAVTDVAEVLELDARLKWPNDIVMPGGAKVGGVLVESTIADGRCTRTICGVGVNVDVDEQEVPPEATSFAAHLGAIEPVAVLPYLLAQFEHRRSDPTGTFEMWRERSETLGRPVTASTHEGEVSGLALDINDNGGLIVSTDTGTETVSPDQCRHLRYARDR